MYMYNICVSVCVYMYVYVCVCVCAQSLSCVLLFAIPWTAACQAPLSMGCSRQEHWSGFARPPVGDLSDPGSNPSVLHPLHWQAASLPLAPPGHMSQSLQFPCEK